MTEENSNAIKLQIWEAIMRRVQRFYPTQTGLGGGGAQGVVYFMGQPQYSSETPCVQPLDAAKQVQAVFDAMYPPKLTVTVSKRRR